MIPVIAGYLDWNGRLLDLMESVLMVGGLLVYFRDRFGLHAWWRRHVRWRWSGRRAALRQMRDIRRFDANPRLLIADIARRIVGLAMVGSAILLNDAMYANDHVHALAGHPVPALRWELMMNALVKLAFVTLLVLGGAQTVDRIERWADPPKARRTFLQRHGRNRLISRKDRR